MELMGFDRAARIYGRCQTRLFLVSCYFPCHSKQSFSPSQVSSNVPQSSRDRAIRTSDVTTEHTIDADHDIEDLMLQTTIHLGDPQTTANFIEGAPASYFRRSYSLDAMSSEAFKRLRSSLFGQPAPSLYYNHTLLALDLYIAILLRHLTSISARLLCLVFRM
jgi:hypothetical protein